MSEENRAAEIWKKIQKIPKIKNAFYSGKKRIIAELEIREPVTNTTNTVKGIFTKNEDGSFGSVESTL
jgi:hypothetical protein